MSAAPSIMVNLINESLWKTFGENNEMIVNKKGRNLFPMLGCTIANLEPESMYTIGVRMVPTDEFRYRFENGSWKQQSFITDADPIRSVGHQDGYKSGEKWMEGEIQFPSLKISNDKSLEDLSTIVIAPNQKYEPCIDVWKLSDDQKCATAIFSHCFETAKFMAVTAYKNKRIAELKKLNNKHAACKRRRFESPDEENQRKRWKNVEEPSRSSVPPADPLPFSVSQFPNSQSVPSESFSNDFPYSSLSQAQNCHHSISPTVTASYSGSNLVYPDDPYHAANFFTPLPPPKLVSHNSQNVHQSHSQSSNFNFQPNPPPPF